MMAVASTPRVALFADTFHEVNGVARTCREWESFARHHDLPLLTVRWGPQPGFSMAGNLWTLELSRSRLAFRIDPDLRFDPLFYRSLDPIRRTVERFQPDVIHVTSPGDLGIAGSILAAKLKTPLVLSWHTNIHEFAARRIAGLLRWAPGILRDSVARATERFVMDRVSWFFGRGQGIFAPNPELAAMLRARTAKPVFPMGRGIDTRLFHPQRRERLDDELVLGFVGRLMPEKNLRLLPCVAAALLSAGMTRFRFQITGSGSERRWLERNLPQAVFTGVLKGEPLARAYADMDVFLFPSRTDTFGNVVQEALASGVPAVVMNQGGPRFIVREGSSGFVASSDDDFCGAAVALALNPGLRRRMASQARQQVEGQSWDRVFTEVYEGYARLLQPK
jgi:glycosyltransferase involved in cell wall biosynthesis